MRNASRICVSSLRHLHIDLRFQFCFTVPVLPLPDWPVVCLAIGRTGVSLSVHLYMVITGRLALVLLEVPLSVPPDWPVGAASSSAFYEEGQCVSGPSECSNVIIVIVVAISPTYHLFRTFIVHFSDLKG